MNLSSSIIRKMIVAVCGLVWMGFVAGHMAGNLLILVSPELYNRYGHAIVSNKPLLYGTEIALILALLGHVVMGIWLTIENRKAAKTGITPNKYAVAPANAKKRARFGSNTMAFQGTIILVFIITHLNTFKYGSEYFVTYDGVEMRDLHRLVIEVFSQPAYLGWYLLCLVLLGIHLSHGFWSVFQSIGINSPKLTPVLKKAGYLYAGVVAAGFLVQPLYVYLAN